MRVFLKFLLPTLAGLLLAGTCRAQDRPAPALPAPGPAPAAPASEPLEVRVELPRVVGVLSDCARILFSRQSEDDKFRRLVRRVRTRREESSIITLRVNVPPKVSKTLGIAP